MADFPTVPQPREASQNPGSGSAGDGNRQSPVSPPVPWGIVDAVGAFVLTLALGLLLGGLAGVIPDTVLPEDRVEAVFLPVSLAILGLTALLWVRVRYPGNVGRLVGPTRPTGRLVLIAAGLGLAAYLVINVGLGLLLQMLAELAGQELPEVQEEFREAAGDPRKAPFFALGALIFAPIAEELFFRGMLFPAIARRLGLWAGIILSAAAFSVAHLGPGGTMAHLVTFALIFPLGVLLAWLYHSRGTIVVPMIVHAVFNLIGVGLLLAGVG